VIVLDVNVVIAAFRGDHPHHSPVRRWFDAAFVPGADFVIPDLVWVGFLRIVTGNHVFEIPSPRETAFAFLDAVTRSSAYVSVAGLRDGWAEVSRMSDDADAHGNLIPDAYIATIARMNACPVATMDRDYRRFTGIEIVDPLAT
jgi:uncharacterized protein